MEIDKDYDDVIEFNWNEFGVCFLQNKCVGILTHCINFCMY